MKVPAFFTVSVFALTMACGGGSEADPGDAVTGMFDALQEGNGESAVSYMSESALDEMDEQLELVKLDPEMASTQLAAMGIQIETSDIPDMTARDFAIAMISSPTITAIMQSAEVTIGEVTIDGDAAKVDVTMTVMGETETNTIDVVRENGQWKVTEFGFNM